MSQTINVYFAVIVWFYHRNYAYTIRDKVDENIKAVKQIENNSAEQAMLGDFSKAIDDAILDSHEAHQNQMKP